MMTVVTWQMLLHKKSLCILILLLLVLHWDIGLLTHWGPASLTHKCIHEDSVILSVCESHN
jgi:hypothetical protein